MAILRFDFFALLFSIFSNAKLAFSQELNPMLAIIL